MIKRFLIIATVIGLLVSCPDPATNRPNNKPNNPQKNTTIVFDNTQGICTVVVYDSYQRREEDKIVEVSAGRLSEEIEYTPGASVPFYFLYRVNLKGINGFTLDYVPKEIGKDQTAVHIYANAKNPVKIPKLDETVSSPNDLLSDKSYLLLQNNSSYSFQLHRGTSIISPDNSSATLVNSGERAQYTINPGAASPYQLLVGADYKMFSGSIVSFEAGCVYSFVFDGTVSLIAEVEIKLENVAGIPQNSSGPPIPDAPVVKAEDSLITLHWIAVERAENYEVYLSTEQQPPVVPVKTVAGTTTVLTGLTNKTAYYIWIKAVNSSGSSDFSTRVRGIPWPNNEVPAVPGTPVIIPGINQLTVNWEECGGAVSYEVYINTSATKPSAPEISTDKTSAVIKNLGNEKIYYIWVRAVNSTGKSDYSPLEASTPKIPTVVPSVPTKPVLTAGNRELTVSWQAAELASAYEVWAGTSNNSAQAQKWGDDITGDITETVITGLENETTYYVWIRAKNIVGLSGFSLSTSAKPSAFSALPETPTLPTVIPGSRTLNVSWQSVEGALSYEVWTGVTDNSTNAEKHGGDVSGTSATLTGLVNETTYYVWVKAKNAIGISEFSPQASGTPSAFAVPPPAPQTAPMIIAGSGQLTVSWQTAEGANSYEVWAGTSNNPTLATKRGNDVVDLSSVITGLSNGTTYYVWIKAKNTVGTSNFSPLASGMPSGFLGIPQPPVNSSVSIGNGQISITWTASEGATAYEVWMGTTNNSASATKNGADITTSLSKTISSLTNGTTYYFWIKAKNSYGTSGFSAVASGKPLGTPGIPTLSSAPNQLVVTWTAVAGADEYEVYYGIGTPTTLAVTTSDTTTTISGLTNGTTYFVRLRAKNASGTSDYGAIESKIIGSPGLYRGTNKIGTQNLSDSLTYISSNAATGDDFYIVLGSDESVSPKTLSYSGKTVKITLLGSGIERKINLNTNGSMFTVNSGVTLTLDENISLVGLSTNNAALVYVIDGNLIMNDGAKINGNTNTSSSGIGGGGVRVYSGTFTMNGGIISGNTTNSSGGGGVLVYSNGTFVMNGGKITRNEDKSGYGGGGVFVFGGTFTMYDGTISGNNVNRFGGGVYVYSSGNFTMYGGIISGNTAKEGGGGVNSSNGIFKKLPQSGGQNSGIIYGAEAVGVDSDGIELKNTGYSSLGDSAVYGQSSKYRNTTAGETDQIDTTTGKGLSANGNPPFGQ